MRDSNPRMPGPEPGALPLGESPVFALSNWLNVCNYTGKVLNRQDAAKVWYNIGMSKNITTMHKQSKKGFTLIEIVIVVVVMLILAAVSAAGMGVYLRDARDGQRESKITLLTNALEKYYDEHGEYPSCSSIATTDVAAAGQVLGGLDADTFRMPNASESTTNSISCTGANPNSTTDTIVYTSGQVVSPMLPLNSYILRYYSESESATVSTPGRRTGSISPGGNFPTSNLRLMLDARSLTGEDNTPLTSWPDSSSNNFNATILSGAPKIRKSGSDRYATFSASDALVTPDLSISGTKPRHIVALFSSKSQGNILGLGANADGQTFDLWHYTDNKLIWHGYGANFDTLPTSFVMSPNAWHVVEVWYTGTTVGVRIDGSSTSTVVKAINTANSQFFIGAGGYSAANNLWSGDIKAVYVFNKVLTALEATNVRNSLPEVFPM